MNTKLIIFDLDGTILNTLEDLADSTNYALKVNKLPARTVEEVRCFVGNGIRKLIERAVPEGTAQDVVEKVLEDFTVHYGEHCADKTRPYEGMKEVIAMLRDRGCMTAVVSNKADFAVQELCEQYFPELFDYVIGERQGIRRKPSPDSVLAVLDKLGMAKEETVYVGDSDVDIQTAGNAGIDILSVEWGFRDREFLVKHGAVTLVQSPRELLDKLG